MKAILSIPAFLGALAVGLSVSSAPLAQEQGPPPEYHHYYHHHHHHHRYVDNRCAAEQHHSATTGTVIGAGVGAVAGHEIGKHSHRC